MYKSSIKNYFTTSDLYEIMSHYRLDNFTKVVDEMKTELMYAVKKDLDCLSANKDDLMITNIPLKVKDLNNFGVLASNEEDMQRVDSFNFVHYGILAIPQVNDGVQRPYYTTFYMTDRCGIMLLPSFQSNDNNYYVNCVVPNNHASIPKPKKVCWTCLRNSERGILSSELIRVIKSLTGNFKEPRMNIDTNLFFNLLDDMFKKT